MKLIIMAAGCGRRMGAMLRGRPKCLIEVGGRSLLEWQLAAWQTNQQVNKSTSQHGSSLRDVVVVTGHGAAHLEGMRERGCELVHNAAHASTNMVHSLFCAAERFDDGFVMSYGDIAYQPAVLERVLDSEAAISVAVDVDWRGYWQARFGDHLLDDAESLATDGRGRITSIGQKVANPNDIEAQYIGLVAFRGRDEGVAALREAWRLAQAGGSDALRAFSCLAQRPAGQMYMTDLLQGMVNLGAAVTAEPIHGGWVEVDSPRDLEVAERRMAAKRHKRHKRGEKGSALRSS